MVNFPTLSPSAFPRVLGETTAKLSGPVPPSSSHDRYESHDLLTTPTGYQRQQHRVPPQTPPPPPPHTPEQRPTSSSQHRLRRTPRFSATPSPNSRPEKQPIRPPPERVTVFLGPQGRYVLAGDNQRLPDQREHRRPGRRLSQELIDSADESSTHSLSPQHQATGGFSEPGQSKPHSAVRISKNTHRAILYALEEGLRGPKQYTDDYAELYAPMADFSGGFPTTSNGKATMSRPIAARAPAPTGSPGIKGPRVIMQERAAREAAREKQREERERLEREHAEAEARAQEEAISRETERRAAAAAGAGPGPSGTGADVSTSRRPGQTTASRVRADEGSRGEAYPPVPDDGQAQGTQRHIRATSGPSQPAPGATAGGAANQPQPGGASASAGGSRTRSSFPHAFERWEHLSAHWEGLTNFWVRRLEQNADEIAQDPISQQLARQVTDLSSAGANLFHAVVELQRLRASSERKFQRWFFETRSELERNQEVAAMLEAALEEERRTRTEAIRNAVEREKGTSKLQKQLAEMRKELLISKEEARRAWEELGRREQEERERTSSLQEGHPTIVGGVQVVPMSQGIGRSDSRRDPRDPRAYGQAEPSDYIQSPVSRAVRPEYTQAPAVQPTSTSAGGSATYQAPSGVHHEQSYASEGGYSEGEYMLAPPRNFFLEYPPSPSFLPIGCFSGF